jgi:type VI secretion system protein ImpA
MPDLDIEPLLSPLEGDAPCGVDLEYDPAFLALLEAGAGKPETQFGDKVYPATPPDWSLTYDRALELARRTRDLRVAVWVTRAAAHVHGLTGVVGGLQLVQGLIERHWDAVHPRLDPGDGNDPTMRVNGLAPLAHPDAGLADIRAATLTETRGGLRVRDLELGIGRAEPLAGEVVPTKDGILKALATAIEATPGLDQALLAGHEAVVRIDTALAERIGADRGPDFGPLTKLFAVLALAARRVSGTAELDTAPSAGDAASARPMVSAPGTISSREDALQALQRASDWIERNEPSNPAPLLIRRAQRLMSKNFLEIIRDLVPDGMGQVEKLAGIGSSE